MAISTEKGGFAWLLAALLVILFGVALADDLSALTTPGIRALVFSGFLLIGVWSLRGFGRFFTIGMTLVVASISLNVIAVISESAALRSASYVSLFGFLVTATSCTLRQVVFGTDISANRLIGAICVYLLLGIMWSIAYTFADFLAPGSFHGFELSDTGAWDSDLVYFSFVTMTTVGYGDILPVSATAKSLAYLQAVVGQFYIAILVAGLVSAYISRRHADRR